MRFAAAVDSLVKVPLASHEKAALVDFTFNVGSKNLQTSTLLKLLNAGDYAGAANEFPKWNLASGKVMPGLVKRRARERSLFLTGTWT
ncbi:Phage lysin / Phage lysozyme or muramidase [Caballeronia sordidicola]|uniref:Lysozyme n=2 Tax=Caballeronia sordidicola TaxID=196367 RepID=A0A242N7A0_CABSO|nr:Phage lysin / Phage lysozyme or muramidase [Caballeronia sordidicola]